jgi:hypothetical protein
MLLRATRSSRHEPGGRKAAGSGLLSQAKMLRSIKTLEKINDKPAAEFWKQVDGK